MIKLIPRSKVLLKLTSFLKGNKIREKIRIPFNVSTVNDIEGVDYIFRDLTMDELYPSTVKLYDKDRDFVLKRDSIDMSKVIPYIPEKEITLTNAGNLTGVTLSTNMLDSIAKYAKRYNFPIMKAISIPATETGLGVFPSYTKLNPYYIDYYRKIGGNFKLNNYVTPTDLFNDHNYFVSPEREIMNVILKEHFYDPIGARDSYINTNEAPTSSYITNSSWSDYFNSDIEDKIDKVGKAKERTGLYTENISPYEHAFRYMTLGRYNSGDPNWEVRRAKRELELFNSPEIQEWLKSMK